MGATVCWKIRGSAERTKISRQATPYVEPVGEEGGGVGVGVGLGVGVDIGVGVIGGGSNGGECTAEQ
jgi:hypothetical protein